MLMFFMKYIAQCARLSFSSSWAAANGIIGSLLGAIALAILGPLQFLPSGAGSGPSLNVAMSLTLFVVCGGLAIFILQTIFVSPFRLWLHNKASIDKAEAIIKEFCKDLITLAINKVRFDPNGPSELYVYYELRNPGEQTILKNWQLTITSDTPRAPIVIAPRFIETGKIIKDTQGIARHENMETTPIERGGVRQGKFGFTFAGSAKETLGEGGGVFNLSADDVKGRKIEASYSYVAIPDHD